MVGCVCVHGRYGSSPESGGAAVSVAFGSRVVTAPAASASASASAAVATGPVRVRRTSTNNSAARPVSVVSEQHQQHQQHGLALGAAPGSPSRYQRAASVQPRSSGELDRCEDGNLLM